MAKTRGVLLDLDGTLFDHASSSGAGIEAVMQRYDVLEDPREVVARYEQLRAQTVVAVLQGELSPDAAREHRFSTLLEELGVPEAADAAGPAAHSYLKAYRNQGSLMPGAKKVLKELRDQGLRLAILSDFSRQSQQAKVAATGLDRLVDAVLYLDDVPAPRPDPVAFTTACAALEVEPKHCVMVGDSLPQDISGALDAGLRAIWFSPARPDLAPAREVTTISSLEQIVDHL